MPWSVPKLIRRRARHRQDRCSPTRSRSGAGPAAAQLAHQVHHQGAAGPLRIRRGVAACATAQLGDERVSRTSRNYIVKRQALARRSTADEPVVLLIDEIDKADIEFPNDLLRELDRMEFYCYETGETHPRRAPAGGDHHLEQREGTARRLPAPLLLPLHQVPRCGDDAEHRRRCTLRASSTTLLAAALRDLLRRAQPARA
ncbi:hypothetical protein ACRAWD_15680 [Caulobacter segnis]